jgi:beta-glucanase (GH16 family)
MLPTFEATFEGTSLDHEQFQFEVGANIRNSDLQAYTESPDNVSVDQGELVITARHETNGDAEYTSGSVETTEGFTFGRIEASILAPTGNGAGPVFWLLPAEPGEPEITCRDETNCAESTWPVWGGMVIFSGRAGGSMIAAVSFAHENEAAGRLDLMESATSVSIGPSVATEYHLYALEWGPKRLDWFVDGELVHTFSLESPDIYYPTGLHPFHQAFRIKLALSVGGLIPAPTALEDYPVEMRVRSLRVLQAAFSRQH